MVQDEFECEQGAAGKSDRVVGCENSLPRLIAPPWSGVDPPRREIVAIDGKLDPGTATPAELRGQELFFGKAQCGSCHPAPYYTDNLMHNLKAERFYEPRMINGEMASADGPIKTFPLRGIKESPTYLHDGRLLTLEDTVDFFNLILGVKLTPQEKTELVAFMRAL